MRPARALRPDAAPSSDIRTGILESDLPEEAWIRCAACTNPITFPDAAVQVRGGHVHTFANPHGMVFEIGLFSDAPGCGAVGMRSKEFTWFSGFAWRPAVCRTCLTHLGWLFTSEATEFWGLILDRLIRE
jgi:hypothetical protein